MVCFEWLAIENCHLMEKVGEIMQREPTLVQGLKQYYYAMHFIVIRFHCVGIS